MILKHSSGSRPLSTDCATWAGWTAATSSRLSLGNRGCRPPAPGGNHASEHFARRDPSQYTPVLAELRKLTTTLPTVFVQVTDPAGSGFVPSLARPGGNVTGFTNFEFS